MKKLLVVAGVAAAIAMPNLAQAEDSKYFGVNYERWSIKDDSGKDLGISSVTFNPAYLTFTGGYNFNKNFAIEGKLGLGISDSSKNLNLYEDDNVDLTGKITNDPNLYMGVFGVAKLPLNDSFEIYGKAGLNYISFDYDYTVTYTDKINPANSRSLSGSSSVSETKFAIAAGANIFVDGKNGLNFEYLAPSIADFSDIHVLSIGYVRKF